MCPEFAGEMLFPRTEFFFDTVHVAIAPSAGQKDIDDFAFSVQFWFVCVS
jgi:hypothetical protein